jgi:Tol biopolymer transport system component
MVARALALLAILSAANAFGANAPSLDNPKERFIRNVTQLTDEGDNGEAYFSWDGSMLIWQSNRGGRGCDKIWTMKTDGSEKKMVSPDHGANTCSFFMPGDKKIVYGSTAHLPEACPPKPDLPGKHMVWALFPYDIFAADSDGNNPKDLTADNPEYDAEPIVSADGRKIVFGSKRGGDFDIYTMDSDGGNVKKLTDTYGYDGGPWFSPDGKKIVWRAWHPQTPEEKAQWKDCMDFNYIFPMPLDIWLMDADGSNKVRLTDNGATNWSPSWHPDGKRIIFSSNMDDWRGDIGKFGHNFELYIMNADGTNLKRLTYNETFDSFPMFSPDGKKLSFCSNRNPQKPRSTDVFIADWVE